MADGNTMENTAGGRPDPFKDMDPVMFAKRFGRRWRFAVVDAFDVSPHMRRVVVTAPDLDEMTDKPGQSVILLLDQPGGEPARRHYTIRSVDKKAKRLSIDFVLHGEAPGASWARDVKPGTEIDALGPRGRVALTDTTADWHLLAADETGLPAVAAIIEALPAGAKAHAFIEVGSAIDELPIDTRADLTLEWLHRNGPATPSSPLLIEKLAAFKLPEGNGRAYLVGETSTVRAQRQGLAARGVAKDRIASEGYWRPGRVGGHDHVDE